MVKYYKIYFIHKHWYKDNEPISLVEHTSRLFDSEEEAEDSLKTWVHLSDWKVTILPIYSGENL